MHVTPCARHRVSLPGAAGAARAPRVERPSDPHQSQMPLPTVGKKKTKSSFLSERFMESFQILACTSILIRYNFLSARLLGAIFSGVPKTILGYFRVRVE